MAVQCLQPTAAQRLTSRSQHAAQSFAGSTHSLRQLKQRQRLQKTLIARAEVDVSQQTGALEKSGPDFKPLKDVQAIMDVLPHRCASGTIMQTALTSISNMRKVCLIVLAYQLENFLHCRFPFLLVDRVIELEPEKYAVGYKNVTINDNFFPGHFPQRAIMPGKSLCLCS